MRMMIAALVVAVAMAPSADAQTYVGRERLKGLKPAAAAPVRCGTLTVNRYAAGNNGGATHQDGVTTQAAAQASCEAARSARGPGTCSWVNGGPYSDANRVYYNTAVQATGPLGSAGLLWATVCS